MPGCIADEPRDCEVEASCRLRSIKGSTTLDFRMKRPAIPDHHSPLRCFPLFDLRPRISRTGSQPSSYDDRQPTCRLVLLRRLKLALFRRGTRILKRAGETRRKVEATA